MHLFRTLMPLLLCGIALPAAATQNLDGQVLRVDVPLEHVDFVDGELSLGELISDGTYIDAEEFYLRAVELEATTYDQGEVRLKVGRYITPAVPLPLAQSNSDESLGALRINAPHRSHRQWRLLFDNQVSLYRLTAILEPRELHSSSYYERRYQQRYGYHFLHDPYAPLYSSRLRYSTRFGRQDDFWFWITPPSARFFDSYGYHGHYRVRPPGYSYRDRVRRHERRYHGDRVRDRRRVEHDGLAESRRGAQPPNGTGSELPRARIGDANRGNPRNSGVAPRRVRQLETTTRSQSASRSAQRTATAQRSRTDSLAAQRALQAQLQARQRRSSTRRAAPANTQRTVSSSTARRAASPSRPQMGPQPSRRSAPRRVGPVQVQPR